tara:strand:+ start:7813 stop:8163 length:351 start_codon:yes stop_codon:yes gene_type:complete
MDRLTRQKIEDGRIIIESALEFKYQSKQDPDSYYLVDLSAYGGSGACYCEQFRFRIEPKILSGSVAPHETGSQCKHILLSKFILGQKVIDSTIEKLRQYEENPPKKKNPTKKKDIT